MINIIRKGGDALVISSARTLMETPDGVVADFGGEDNMYHIENMTLGQLNSWTEGVYSSMVNIPGEWSWWPT